MRVLVTGASGFVGEHLVKHLLEQGHEVKGTSRKMYPPFPKEDQYEHVTLGDPFSIETWRPITTGVDTVVHLIAKTHSPETGKLSELENYRHINVDITKAVLEASLEASVRRFIYMSSIKAVGEETPPGEAFSEDSPCKPADSYGISKREAEELILDYSEKIGTVILRPPLIYGPGVKGNLLRLMSLAAKGIKLPLGGIHNQRSYIYSENLADAALLVIQGAECRSGIFHVADQIPVSTPSLYNMLLRHLGKNCDLLNLPEGLLRKAATLVGKGADYRKLAGSLVVSSEKFRRTCNWEEPFSFDEGIEKTCRWYKAKGQVPVEKECNS